MKICAALPADAPPGKPFYAHFRRGLKVNNLIYVLSQLAERLLKLLRLRLRPGISVQDKSGITRYILYSLDYYFIYYVVGNELPRIHKAFRFFPKLGPFGYRVPQHVTG